MKNIEIIGGGTVFHIRNHLALAAPAYGKTARQLENIVLDNDKSLDYDINLYLTKMANRGTGSLETNEDIANFTDELVANPSTKIIFFNPALVDFEGYVPIGNVLYNRYDPYPPTKTGKHEERLKTSNGTHHVIMTPTAKIVSKIRKERKDIFLVAFKTTCGANEDEQFLAGLHLLKSSSCNLVLANDTKTRVNMIITPEQARYSVSTGRIQVLKDLVEMTLSRAKAHFTRSTVVGGHCMPWNSRLIPSNLIVVVDHCVKAGAYKPFNGSTVGHFAAKISNTDFITSKRKTNFNKLNEVGMVLCRSENDNEVIAYGAKPSVGGQSQRIIFKEHPGYDCIVHFHCPPKPNSELSIRSQRDFECGSHECGKNTSDGLVEAAPGIKCVYLDNHGPNIIFNKETRPQDVIKFIDNHFDLSRSTDGIDRNKISVQ